MALPYKQPGKYYNIYLQLFIFIYNLLQLVIISCLQYLKYSYTPGYYNMYINLLQLVLIILQLSIIIYIYLEFIAIGIHLMPASCNI